MIELYYRSGLRPRPAVLKACMVLLSAACAACVVLPLVGIPPRFLLCPLGLLAVSAYALFVRPLVACWRRALSIEEELPFIALVLSCTERAPTRELAELARAPPFEALRRELKLVENACRLGYPFTEALRLEAEAHPSDAFRAFLERLREVELGLASPESLMRLTLRILERRLEAFSSYLEMLLTIVPTALLAVPALTLPALLIAGLPSLGSMGPALLLACCLVSPMIALLAGAVMPLRVLSTPTTRRAWAPALPAFLIVALAAWRPVLELELLLLASVCLLIASLVSLLESREVRAAVEHTVRLLESVVESATRAGLSLHLSLQLALRRQRPPALLTRPLELLRTSYRDALSCLAEPRIPRSIRLMLASLVLVILRSRSPRPLARFLASFRRVYELQQRKRERLFALLPALLLSMMVYAIIVHASSCVAVLVTSRALQMSLGIPASSSLRLLRWSIMAIAWSLSASLAYVDDLALRSAVKYAGLFATAGYAVLLALERLGLVQRILGVVP